MPILLNPIVLFFKFTQFPTDCLNFVVNVFNKFHNKLKFNKIVRKLDFDNYKSPHPHNNGKGHNYPYKVSPFH